MRLTMLLPMILVALPMAGCAEPTVTETSADEIVIHHMAALDDGTSLQAQADSACDKYGKKAKFDRYEEDTLLGPRDAYFYCVSPVTAAQ